MLQQVEEPIRSQRAMAKEFGVAKATARSVIKMLAAEKSIETPDRYRFSNTDPSSY